MARTTNPTDRPRVSFQVPVDSLDTGTTAFLEWRKPDFMQFRQAGEPS